MAFDFPSDPIVDQEYTPVGSPQGQTYIWKPPRWIVKNSGTSGGGGDSVAWENITNKPATFPPTVPIAQVNVTNLVADLAAKAPLASPALTGAPTAPTAAPGTSTTQIASTAFVGSAVAAVPPPNWSAIPGKPATYPPTLPIAESDVTNLVADLALKAPLASPALTGTPTAPTAAPGTSTTQIASTAFVGAAIIADITPWAEITGKPATFPPTVPISWADVSGKPPLYPPQVPIDWVNISNTPATYPPTVPIAWADIAGKPLTYPPTLPIAQAGITNLVNDLAAKEPIIAAGNSTYFWRGDKTWQPLPPSGITDAPSDGNTYGRKNAAWAIVLGGASISDTAPAGAVHGQLWWNSANANFYIYYNDGDTVQWVQINLVGT
jgi:hypothetical protein